MQLPLLMFSAFLMTFANIALANEDVAGVSDVQVRLDSPDQPGIFHFSVTIEHQDAGWDDYIEAWEIVDAEGNFFGSRPFFEPTVEEQTVTALSGVIIPSDVKTVMIQARNFPNGVQTEPFEIQIPH